MKKICLGQGQFAPYRPWSEERRQAARDRARQNSQFIRIALLIEARRQVLFVLDEKFKTDHMWQAFRILDELAIDELLRNYSGRLQTMETGRSSPPLADRSEGSDRIGH